MDAVTNDIRQFVVDNFLFGQDGHPLGEDTSFLEAGIIDSTGVLELVGFLQSRFGFDLEDAEIVPENLDSLRQLGAFVTRKLEQQACLEVRS